MKSPLVDRLFLPSAMAMFLLLSLAYWWLENVPHEIFGMAMFALLGWHIVVNRLWFRNLFRGRYDGRRIVVVSLHLALISSMLTLFISSVLISKSLVAWLPISDSVYLREVHWFSAYWLMIIVGSHLGLHWIRVMSIAYSTVGLASGGVVGPFFSRAVVVLIASLGVWSFSVLDVWSKLTFTYSLDVWNFNTSVSPFFGHWAAVVALPAILTHYGMILSRKYRSDRVASYSSSPTEDKTEKASVRT